MPSACHLRLALCAALLTAGLATSHALQLGESAAQITARHGAPPAADNAQKMAMYFWENWSARIDWSEGVVGKLTYKKNDYLLPTDIASLLQANGGVAQWKEITTQGSKLRQWARKDGAHAECEAVRAMGMVFKGKAPPHPVETALENAFSASFAQADATPATLPPVRIAPVATPPPSPTAVTKPVLRTLPQLRATEPVEERAAPEIAPVPTFAVAAVASPPAAPAPPATETAAPVPAVVPAAPKLPAQEPSIAGPVAGLFALLALLGGVVFFLKSRAARAPAASPARDETTAEPPPSLPKAATHFAGLDALRWDQLELLVGEIFRREGYTVELSAALGADGGIDLTLRRGSETALVQCKHWKTSRVSAREMREFYGAMAAGGTPRGIFVTTGTFTRDARDFAAGKSIDLVDRRALEERLAAAARPGENLCCVAEWIEEFAGHARIFDPECPFCRGTMVIRHHRTAGSAFWGCRSYPRCSGKRDPRLDLLALESERATALTARAA